MPVLVVEEGDIDKDVEHIRADVIFVLVGHLFIVVSDVELSDQVEEIHLFKFAIVGQMVEEFGYVERTGDHALNNSAEGFEDGGVVDGSEEELYLLDINVVLSDLLLQLNLIFGPSFLLDEVDIGLVDEDEHAAVVGIFAFEILVDVMEGVAGLVEVGGGTQDVDEGGGVLKDHLFVGRRLVDVVLGWEVVQFELDLLDLEVVALHLAGLNQHLGRLRDHLLEDDFCDAAATCLRVAHQEYVHAIIYGL